MVWNVAVAHRPPFAIVSHAQSPPTFSGILVDLLPMLFMEAGFNTTASSCGARCNSRDGFYSSSSTKRIPVRVCASRLLCSPCHSNMRSTCINLQLITLPVSPC